MDQLIQALTISVQGKSNNQIKAAQLKLKQISQDVNFISAIQNILSNQQCHPQLKLAASVQVLNRSRFVANSKDQSQFNIHVQKVLALLRNPVIQIKYKIHLANAVQTMMSVPQRGKKMRGAFFENLKNTLKQIDYQNLQKYKDQLQYIGLLGQITMTNPGFGQDSVNFLINTFPFIIRIIQKIIFDLQNSIKNQSDFDLFTNLQQLRIYVFLFKLYFRKFGLHQLKLTALIYDDRLEPIFTKLLVLSLPNNNFGTSLFYINDSQKQLSKIINQIKNNALYSLHCCIRYLMNNVKDPNILKINMTFLQCKTYVPEFIKNVEVFLDRFGNKYHQLTDQTCVKSLDNIMGLIYSLIKINDFYSIFHQYRTQLVQKIIFRIVSPTPRDIQNFQENPEQFLNQLIHAIQRQSSMKAKPIILNSLAQYEQQYETKDQTLKISATNILLTLGKYQDGALAEIFKLIMVVLQGKVNLNFPNIRCTLMVVLCLLRDGINKRPQFHGQILTVVTKVFQSKTFPKVDDKKQKLLDNMEYTYGMILLWVYLGQFIKTKSGNNVIAQHTFKLVLAMIKQPKTLEIIKIVSYQLIERLNYFSRQTDMVEESNTPQILAALNEVLIKSGSTPSPRLLQCIFSIFKANDLQLLSYLNVVVDTLNCLSNIVKIRMEQGLWDDKIIVNKCFNIIKQVGENSDYIPGLIPDMEKCLMPLLPFLENSNAQIDYQQDIFLLLASFIEKSRQVTPNQLKMFEYIPKIFYGRYNYSFGHSFNTLQIFMFYGKQILMESPIAIKQIFLMCKQSMFIKKIKDKQHSEADNCEGLLILQSLILSCGSIFDKQFWAEIIKTLNERLSQGSIQHNFFKSNIIATLALSLLGGFKFFENEQNTIVLEKILSNCECFDEQYSSKVLIVALSELIVAESQNIAFIQAKLTFIFDMSITILKFLGQKKQTVKWFVGGQQASQDKDYDNLVNQMVNSIINLDEFQYFKSKIMYMKQTRQSVLHKVYQMLPASKKDYLKSIVTFERVLNQPRQIFKIKRRD